jgi:hypothetical protein
MPVCRVLVIEDRNSSANTLCRLLDRLGAEMGITVDCTPLVCKNIAEFQSTLQTWYTSNGGAASSAYLFDITSLDMIFQATPNMSQADGGAQLFAWLDQRNAIPNLGHIVVRSYQNTDAFSQHAGTIVHKDTSHEKEKWRELLEKYKRP